MATEEKKSFIMYCDYRQHLSILTDEERGRLLMALLDYGETGTEPHLDGAAMMAFSFIASQMDRDAEKYAKTVQKRREAGKQGGRPKAKESTKKQTKAKKANGFTGKQTKAKKPDNDNDNDNDNDTDNGNGITITPYSPPGETQTDVQERRFAEFWETYPKKVGKQAARNAWLKVKPGAELFGKIMQAVLVAKKSDQWSRDGGRFIPNPSTWINQGRWDDELTPAAVTVHQEGGQIRGNYRGHNDEHGHQEGAGNETTLTGFHMADG